MLGVDAGYDAYQRPELGRGQPEQGRLVDPQVRVGTIPLGKVIAQGTEEPAIPGEAHLAQVVYVELGQLLEQVVDLRADEFPDGCTVLRPSYRFADLPMSVMNSESSTLGP